MVMSSKELNISSCPLVTFVLLTYNQEKYIQEAVESAFAQTYEPLVILISDDASTDRTYKIIEEMVKDYQGPHKIIVNRNDVNEGLIGHVNKIFDIVRSEILVMAAGDDISIPCRTSRIVQEFLKGEDIYLVHSNVMKIDENKKEMGVMIPPIIRKKMMLHDIAIAEGVHVGASAGYRKSIYDYFGPIDRHDVYEDLILSFRSSLLGKIAYVNEPLVCYRYGMGISAKNMGSKNSIISSRMKSIRINITNLKQKKMDFAKSKNFQVDSNLQNIIMKAIRAYRIRYLLYKNTCLFLAGIFAKKRAEFLRALFDEMIFLLWRLIN